MNWASYWLGVATTFVIPLGAADIYFLIRLGVYLHQYYFTDHCSSSQCIICNTPELQNDDPQTFQPQAQETVQTVEGRPA